MTRTTRFVLNPTQMSQTIFLLLNEMKSNTLSTQLPKIRKKQLIIILFIVVEPICMLHHK